MNRTLTLKQYRELMQYKQKEVAETLEITQAAYSQIESGMNQTSIENYKKIAAFFKIDIDYVMMDSIPVFIYIYNKNRSLESGAFSREIEQLLNEISDKIQKLKKNHRDF